MQDEVIQVEKFLLISKKRQYALVRALLALLTTEAREFVLRVLEDNVFGNTRLNPTA